MEQIFSRSVKQRTTAGGGERERQKAGEGEWGEAKRKVKYLDTYMVMTLFHLLEW
jgi:hypothetical protein